MQSSTQKNIEELLFAVGRSSDIVDISWSAARRRQCNEKLQTNDVVQHVVEDEPITPTRRATVRRDESPITITHKKYRTSVVMKNQNAPLNFIPPSAVAGMQQGGQENGAAGGTKTKNNNGQHVANDRNISNKTKITGVEHANAPKNSKGASDQHASSAKVAAFVGNCNIGKGGPIDLFGNNHIGKGGHDKNA
eukprot:GSA25T00001264001.1